MSEHRTEVDGWIAEWRLDHHHIRMMLVCNTSQPQPLLSVTIPAAAPDLAYLREQYPHLSRLWDAIRHQYWAHLLHPASVHTARSETKGVVVITDLLPAHIQLVTKRAERAGYRLVRDPGAQYAWTLLDAADGAPLHSAATLELIEQFLAQ
jgi:hypothetical protein